MSEKNICRNIKCIRKEITMEICYDGALVMPKNYAVVDEEEMTYVDGGATFSSNQCKNFVAALGLCSGQALIAIAAGAVAVTKLKKLFSTFSVLGGPLTFILNLAIGVIATAAGKVLYGIGYCAAFNKTLTVNGTAAPWDAFVDVSWS